MVLYNNIDVKHAQYFKLLDWPGGLYGTAACKYNFKNLVIFENQLLIIFFLSYKKRLDLGEEHQLQELGIP